MGDPVYVEQNGENIYVRLVEVSEYTVESIGDRSERRNQRNMEIEILSEAKFMFQSTKYRMCDLMCVWDDDNFNTSHIYYFPYLARIPYLLHKYRMKLYQWTKRSASSRPSKALGRGGMNICV